MNVVSYCIFGERDLYWDSAPAVVRAHHNLFPSWEMWVYQDDLTAQRGPFLRRCADHGLIKLIDCGKSEKVGVSALWRFKPIWEPGVDYMLSRDIDSLPLPKDRRMAEVFMQSGRTAHSATDNPSHMGLNHFMAGMCGFHAPLTRQALQIPSWTEFVILGENMEVWRGGPDQVLLQRVLLPAVSGSICYHLLGTAYSGPWMFNKVEPLPLPDVPERILAEGDTLMPFLGCPGFDIPRAIAFYDKWGKPELSSLFHRIEQI